MTSLKSYTSFTTNYSRDIELEPMNFGKGLLIVKNTHDDSQIRAALDVKDAVRLRDALNRLLHQEDQPVTVDTEAVGNNLGHVRSTGPHIGWEVQANERVPHVERLFNDLAEASRDNDVMISFSIVPYGDDDS